MRNNPPAPPVVVEKPLLPSFFRRFSQETLLLAGAVALVLWVWSIWGYHPDDPAWSTTGHHTDVRHVLGRPGATLADMGYFLFGRSLWVLVAAFAAAWLRLLLRRMARAEQAPLMRRASEVQADASLAWPHVKERFWRWVQHGNALWWVALVVLMAACCLLEWSRLYTHASALPSGAGGALGALVGHALQDWMGFTLSGTAGVVLVMLAAPVVFRFSWLNLAERMGRWVDSHLNAARERREVAADIAVGQVAAREREETVQAWEEALDKHPVPIVIDPAPAPAAAHPSERVLQEKQTPLFQEMPDSPLPTVQLLDPAPQGQEDIAHDTLEMTSRLIEKKLKDFGVSVRVVAAMPGPVITRYEIEPATGVKGAQVVNLAKDLARSLSLVSIRVIETIPGKNLMALELPNARRKTIHLSEVLGSAAYHHSKSMLTLGLGKDIVGNPVVADLAKMPHVLVAGTTGSGKSVGINGMILSLLYKAQPQDVRLLMIDPKMLEMSLYEGIPHLLAPVVTDMRQAAHGLNWCVGEMERRYKLMSKMGVRNLASFNAKVQDAQARGEHIPNPFSLTPEAPEPLEKLPHIVIIIDELADLMMVVGKKVEELIARLAQKARAAGIHLILATQRPSVDVITGLIKANIPTRIAFQVSSKIDSRTILEQMGAESLLGMGDMLYLPSGAGLPTRIHGAFVSDDEVHRVVSFLKSQGEPDYIDGVLEGGTVDDDSGAGGGMDGGGETDPLYDQAVEVVLKKRKASISLVQRELRIGYNRAARLLEDMEKAGLVSSLATNGQRDILVPRQEE